MRLNKLQVEVYNSVMYGKDIITVLKGEGGTGKSFVTAKIIADWKGDITVTATTNRAKDVLAVMAKKKTFTVQSDMGYTMVKAGYTQSLKKARKANSTHLLIVDEISMIPLEVYNTILEQITDGKIKKVLFLGDSIQLPAIGEGVDINSIKGTHITLMQQQRQSTEDEALTDFLADLRSAIEFDGDMPSLEDIPSIKVCTSHREFCKKYKEDTGNKKVVAYRNAVVDKYNEYIHHGENRFNVGDQVIIDKPINGSDGTLATNGSEIVIEAVRRSDEYKAFILDISTMAGSTATIYQWDNPTELENYLDTLMAEGNTERYWYIRDKSFRLKHLYACTVHKTQGSTYDTVYIDGTDILAAHTCKPSKWANPIPYDLLLRLFYVAISRMTANCYIYMGTLRNYSNMEA